MNNTDGVRIYLILWKAFKAMEAVDRASIRTLGFTSLSDFSVLEALLHKGPLPVNEIGRRVFLTSGSITSAVDRAADRGWVRRVRREEDRRVVDVVLTEAGRAVIEAAYERHVQALERATQTLDPEERAALVPLLKKLGYAALELLPEIEREEGR